MIPVFLENMHLSTSAQVQTLSNNSNVSQSQRLVVNGQILDCFLMELKPAPITSMKLLLLQ